MSSSDPEFPQHNSAQNGGTQYITYHGDVVRESLGEARRRARHRRLTALVGAGVFVAALLITQAVYQIRRDSQQSGDLARQEEARTDELTKGPALLTEATQYWDEGDPWIWVFDKAVTQQQLIQADDWSHGEPKNQMAQLGGERVSTYTDMPMSRYRITLTGHRNTKVRISGIHAEIVREYPAPMGSIFGAFPQGGDPVDSIFVDLDSPDRVAMTMSGGEPTKTPFTIAENRYANPDEPLGFKLMATTVRPIHCEWVLKVDVAYDGAKKETVTVEDSNGKPFVTTGWNTKWPYHTKYEVRKGRGIVPYERP